MLLRTVDVRCFCAFDIRISSKVNVGQQNPIDFKGTVHIAVQIVLDLL